MHCNSDGLKNGSEQKCMRTIANLLPIKNKQISNIYCICMFTFLLSCTSILNDALMFQMLSCTDVCHLRDPSGWEKFK